MNMKSNLSSQFQANRSMILNKNIKRPISAMIADAFWYEDNRRIYQISRPAIVKYVHLYNKNMILSHKYLFGQLYNIFAPKCRTHLPKIRIRNSADELN